MLGVGVRLFLCIGVLTSLLPLRACFIQQTLTQSNCHDRDTVSFGSTALADNEACPPHDEPCVCKADRFAASIVNPVVIDQAVLHETPPVFASISPLLPDPSMPRNNAALPLPPSARYLPLLI